MTTNADTPEKSSSEHTPAEMLAIIGRLNRHHRRAGASMLRHGKPLVEVFERLTGFANRKRTWVDAGETPGRRL